MYPSNVMNKLVYVDFYIMCHRELCTCVDNILGSPSRIVVRGIDAVTVQYLNCDHVTVDI